VNVKLGDHAAVCFTNPAEKIAYVIPVDQIVAQLEAVEQLDDSIEVVIYRADDRWKWHELDRSIRQYLKQH